MVSKDREYRAFSFDTDENEMRATGQAVVFNSPEVMYEYDGVKYMEQIDSRAFDEANMKDVVLVINHEGTPAARTRNGTLKLTVRDNGLFVDADLSKSSVGAALHSDIKNGVYDKMSFAFTVKQDSYNKETRTRTIEKIDRLYDVSAVTFPAYNATSISARSYFEAEAEKEAAEAAEIERKQKLIQLIGGSI